MLRFSQSDSPATEDKSFELDINHSKAHLRASVSSANKALKNWQSTSIDWRLIILQRTTTDQSWLQQIDAVAREKLAQPIELPGPTGEDNRLSVQGRGVVTLIVTAQDSLSDAEKQIASALLCGCSVIVTADNCHQEELKILQNKYADNDLPKNLLQLATLENLAELIQDNQVEGIMANSLNADSSSLRQAMAKRSGSIIPLIEWPQRDKDYSYHWLLWFLSERTRTENLVARGGNTKLFNLEE